jgi:hypothetical protein
MISCLTLNAAARYPEWSPGEEGRRFGETLGQVVGGFFGGTIGGVIGFYKYGGLAGMGLGATIGSAIGSGLISRSMGNAWEIIGIKADEMITDLREAIKEKRQNMPKINYAYAKPTNIEPINLQDAFRPKKTFTTQDFAGLPVEEIKDKITKWFICPRCTEEDWERTKKR